MEKVQLSGDIVTGVFEGDAPGMPLPDALKGVPVTALRLKGGELIDARKLKTFYVDEDGVRHAEKLSSRWQSVTGDFSSALAKEDGKWAPRAITPEMETAIRRKADALIVAALPGRSELSMLWLAVSLLAKGGNRSKAENEKLAMVGAVKAWMAEVREVKRRLVEEDEGAGYADNDTWPVPPTGLADFLSEL